VSNHASLYNTYDNGGEKLITGLISIQKKGGVIDLPLTPPLFVKFCFQSKTGLSKDLEPSLTGAFSVKAKK